MVLIVAASVTMLRSTGKSHVGVTASRMSAENLHLTESQVVSTWLLNKHIVGWLIVAADGLHMCARVQCSTGSASHLHSGTMQAMSAAVIPIPNFDITDHVSFGKLQLPPSMVLVASVSACASSIILICASINGTAWTA